MKKKVMGAIEALGEGVAKVIFADGRLAAADQRGDRRRRYSPFLSTKR